MVVEIKIIKTLIKEKSNSLKMFSVSLVRDPCAGFDCGKGTCTAPADFPFCICDEGYTYNPDIRTCVRLISK